MQWNINSDRVQLSGTIKEGGLFYTFKPTLSAISPSTIQTLIFVDFDDTLFVGNGRQFAGSPAIEMPGMLDGIAGLAAATNALVFVATNQAWSLPREHVQERLESGLMKMIQHNIPVCGVLAALGSDWYRKPLPGIHDFVVQMLGGMGFRQTFQKIMIGDAAGRPAGPGRKKPDHSKCDLEFAMNIGAMFMVPEDVINRTGPHDLTPVIAAHRASVEKHLIRNQGRPMCSYYQGPEIVVICGLQGSGKTSTAEAFARAGYARFSYDETKKDLVKLVERATNEDRIVVDRTHSTVESRAAYPMIAQKRGIRSRCIVVGDYPNDMEWSFHKMVCRTLLLDEQKNGIYQGTATFGSYITSLVYKKFKFEVPTTAEGFDVVEHVGGNVDLDACSERFKELLFLITENKI